MFARTLILAFALTQLTACYPVFDFSQPEKLTFDYTTPAPAAMNYADLMCCYQCAV